MLPDEQIGEHFIVAVFGTARRTFEVLLWVPVPFDFFTCGVDDGLEGGLVGVGNDEGQSFDELADMR